MLPAIWRASSSRAVRLATARAVDPSKPTCRNLSGVYSVAPIRKSPGLNVHAANGSGGGAAGGDGTTATGEGEAA